MSEGTLPKIIVLLGPTASGKTGWGIRLAKDFSGEVISADSRQIYRRMDVGTAKPKGEWRGVGDQRQFMVDGVPHHLMDFLNPGKIFTSAEFRDAALAAIHDIRALGHVPMLVGGTGLYISAIVDNWEIPQIAPHKKLRRSLEEKSAAELEHLLQIMDPAAAKQIDPKNKRRVIRALEVCILSGAPFSEQRTKGRALVDALQIGIDLPRDELYRRIDRRVDEMVGGGLIEELKLLLKQKYGWSLSSMSSIGYRQMKGFMEGEMPLEKAIELLKRDTRHFARRQLTWFRRDKRIHWVNRYEEAAELTKEFLR